MQYLEKVDGNWRAGSYELKTIHYYFYWEGREFAVDEDFITNYDYINEHVLIFDRESLRKFVVSILKRYFRPNCPQYQIIDVSTVVYLESKGLAFHDTNTGQLIRRFELNKIPLRFDACCPTAKLWTVVAEFEHVFRLILWTVDNASNLALIKKIEVARFGRNEFQVDEQFILHHQTSAYRKRETVHFISTGKVHDTVLERFLSVMYRWWFQYDRGLLFFINRNQLIRILDVASGTYLHDIDMGIWMPKTKVIIAIKANLNYVVIIAIRNLYVYSLQALRNPLPSDAFVLKIKSINIFIDVMVDDTQIVCLDCYPGQIKVVDFGSFDQTPIPTLAAP